MVEKGAVVLKVVAKGAAVRVAAKVVEPAEVAVEEATAVGGWVGAVDKVVAVETLADRGVEMGMESKEDRVEAEATGADLLAVVERREAGPVAVVKVWVKLEVARQVEWGEEMGMVEAKVEMEVMAEEAMAVVGRAVEMVAVMAVVEMVVEREVAVRVVVTVVVKVVVAKEVAMVE